MSILTRALAVATIAGTLMTGSALAQDALTPSTTFTQDEVDSLKSYFNFSASSALAQDIDVFNPVTGEAAMVFDRCMDDHRAAWETRKSLARQFLAYSGDIERLERMGDIRHQAHKVLLAAMASQRLRAEIVEAFEEANQAYASLERNILEKVDSVLGPAPSDNPVPECLAKVQELAI